MAGAVGRVLVECQYINKNGTFAETDTVTGEGTITEPGFWLITQSLLVRMCE
jgi:hypothetical protein